MANNGLWLKNIKTNEKVLLAKYYPSTGWYCFHEDIKEKLDELFFDSDFKMGSIDLIGSKRLADGTLNDGGNEWVLINEMYDE